VNEATGDTFSGVLKARREVLIACWRAKSTAATTASVSTSELLDRMPDFVDEVIAALHPYASPLPAASGNAGEHGAQRLRLQFDVAEVVREYGLLQDCIIEIARDAAVDIALHEQQVIANWINAGIADAVAQYVKRSHMELERQASEHLGFVAHELRNPLSAAHTALQRLRTRELAAGGRAVELLDRGLRRAAGMIDNALSHASLKLGIEVKIERIALPDLLRDVELEASVVAESRGIDLVIEPGGATAVDADPRLLRSALINLVHNAVKFSSVGSKVIVRGRVSPGRVTIEVADACGGLPAGQIEDLFSPRVQRGEDRSGFGLGLAIARQAVEAHGGHISARDVPSCGCVFAIELPQPVPPVTRNARRASNADDGKQQRRS